MKTPSPILAVIHNLAVSFNGGFLCETGTEAMENRDEASGDLSRDSFSFFPFFRNSTLTVKESKLTGRQRAVLVGFQRSSVISCFCKDVMELQTLNTDEWFSWEVCLTRRSN